MLVLCIKEDAYIKSKDIRFERNVDIPKLKYEMSYKVQICLI